MTTKTKIILVGILTLTAYAFGRYSAPEKIKEVTKIVEVERKVDNTKIDTDRDKHKTTTVTEVVRPDGTKETITTIVEDSETRKVEQRETITQTETASTTIKEIQKTSSKTTISALYGISYSGGKPVYGGHITKGLLGPITLGAFGFTTGVIGVSLGLQL